MVSSQYACCELMALLSLVQCWPAGSFYSHCYNYLTHPSILFTFTILLSYNCNFDVGLWILLSFYCILL